MRRTGPERDLGPAVERLISETRERTHARLARRERLLHAAFSAGFLLAAGTLAAAAPAARELDPVLAVLLVLAYALVARVEFAAGAGIVVPTQLVFVPMLLLLPTPLVPLLVAAAYVLSDLTPALRDRLDAGRAVIAPANAWFSVWPALVLVLVPAQLPDSGAAPWFALALAAQLGGELAMTIARLRLTLGLPAREVLPELVLTTRVDALLAPVGLLAAFGAAGEPYAVLLVLPLVVLFAIFAREREARIDHALELSPASKGTALLLGDVIEADDQYTGDHTRDVVELTLQVADALGVDAETRRGAEWAIMKTHTIEGQRMLERVGGLLAHVGIVVRASHERWDGGGYPDGLAGEQIPLAARIVCVCDAYNAMTTDRSYRRALPVADATAELECCAGTQFDPQVVAALIRVAGATADRAPDWQPTLGSAGRGSGRHPDSSRPYGVMPPRSTIQ